MKRITVRANFVQKDCLFYAAHEDKAVALKSLSYQFAAHCAATGMRVDVHSEFVVDMLRDDFGYHVHIEHL